MATDRKTARYCTTSNRCSDDRPPSRVQDYAREDVVKKGKLGPGDMIALDLKTGTHLASADIDQLLEETPSLQGVARRMANPVFRR